MVSKEKYCGSMCTMLPCHTAPSTSGNASTAGSKGVQSWDSQFFLKLGPRCKHCMAGCCFAALIPIRKFCTVRSARFLRGLRRAWGTLPQHQMCKGGQCPLGTAYVAVAPACTVTSSFGTKQEILKHSWHTLGAIKPKPLPARLSWSLA